MQVFHWPWQRPEHERTHGLGVERGLDQFAQDSAIQVVGNGNSK